MKNKTTITKTVKSKEDLYIEFTEEEMSQLGIKPHDKFSINIKDGAIVLTKFKSLDLDLEEFDKKTLIMLIEKSIKNQVPADEIIRELLEEFLKKNPKETKTTQQEVELDR